jgi:hypothetical protein
VKESETPTEEYHKNIDSMYCGYTFKKGTQANTHVNPKRRQIQEIVNTLIACQDKDGTIKKGYILDVKCTTASKMGTTELIKHVQAKIQKVR